MKISLVHGKYFNSWEALGLGYIGAYLKAHNKYIKIDFYQGCFDDEKTIVNGCQNSDIVVFSCTTPTFAHVLGIARRLKQINPKVWTVVGGYHPSAVKQECLGGGIDQIVIGEGEAAMLDIVMGNREKVIQGQPLEFVDLPWPDRELIRNDRNVKIAYADNKQRIASFQSHRGCPFMCKYCLDGHFKVLYQDKVNIRYRPVEDLLDEMQEITKRYQLDLLKFCDPTWNANVDWVKAFCREKIHRNFATPFYPNMHATMCTEEMINLMAEANCSKMAIGIESGSAKILKQIGKGTTLSSIKRCIGWAKNAKILVRGYFILGMPEETEEDLKLTDQLAEELDLDEYGFSLLCPYPGTQMYDKSKFAQVNWEKADEYSNDFWQTKHVSNQRLKEYQKYLTNKFKTKLTWHNKVMS
jgi:anaerobic magnesium-protoporphyrin IX monomethyl ester cyclase